MVTIKDVARRSGVSVATVSRILSRNGYPVKDETRERVERCAAELGYRPDAIARSLRTSRGSEVAVVIPSFQNPFYTDALSGIERVLTAGGYDLAVYLNRKGQSGPENVLDPILRRKMAGVIIANDCVGGETRKALEAYAAGSPVVLLDGPPADGTSLRGVFFDYRAGARLGVEYLLQRGHEKIALATRRLDRDSRKSVAAGYREAVEHAGLPFDARDVFESDAGEDFGAGLEICGRLLASGLPYTAVLANNDSVAAGVISGMLSAGFSVPGRCSVMGIDDNVYSRMTTPPLTTVRVPSREMGELAAQRMLDALDGRAAQNDVYLPASIAERNSVLRRVKYDQEG